jgi:hypothetical protein
MTFFTNSYSRKTIAHTLLLAMFLNFLAPLLSPLYEVKAGEGPAQPEAAQFEPIDTTDLVSLFTGNFNYSVPLLEIPGPEGGWPISMSYHAGVGPNTEATWVGLGWTLNPGAINRFVNGYPDDYWDGSVQTEIEFEKKSGYGFGIGIGYGPVGVSINYDSYTGQTGVNASFSVLKGIAAIANMGEADASKFAGALSDATDLGAGFSFDLNLQLGTSGVGLSAQLGYNAFQSGNVGGSIGVSAGVHSSQKPSTGAFGGISGGGRSEGNRLGNSMSLLGVSFSSQSEGASFSAGGVGFNNKQSFEGSGHYNMSSMTIPIPIGSMIGIPGLGMSLSYYEWEWWLHEYHFERSFGSIHQLGYLADNATDALEYNIESVWPSSSANNALEKVLKYAEDDLVQQHSHLKNKSASGDQIDFYVKTKVENMEVNKMLFSSEDTYQVNVQGLSGAFRPYFLNPYKLYNEAKTGDERKDGKFDNLGAKNDHQGIVFRFEGEQGGNLLTLNATGDGAGLENIGTEYYQGGKKITPAIDTETGKIIGFEVVAERR